MWSAIEVCLWSSPVSEEKETSRKHSPRLCSWPIGQEHELGGAGKSVEDGMGGGGRWDLGVSETGAFPEIWVLASMAMGPNMADHLPFWFLRQGLL